MAVTYVYRRRLLTLNIICLYRPIIILHFTLEMLSVLFYYAFMIDINENVE